MNRPLLSYDSLEAWAEGEQLPLGWRTQPASPQNDEWFRQFGELKQHLWKVHIASLSPDEQARFRDGTHPSLKHEFLDRVAPYAEALAAELLSMGYKAEVRHVFYHLDRIVLFAQLEKTPPGRLRAIPWLFRGFEVKYRFPDTVP